MENFVNNTGSGFSGRAVDADKRRAVLEKKRKTRSRTTNYQVKIQTIRAGRSTDRQKAEKQYAYALALFFQGGHKK